MFYLAKFILRNADRSWHWRARVAFAGPLTPGRMDDLEQYAGALLCLLIFARLAREVKGVLSPLGRWPVGVKPVGDGDRDGSFLTPEDEFSRWAKNGKGPSGKRLAVSVTAVLLALTCLPVWARTTWTQRARLPLSEIAQETQAQTEPLAFPPPKMRILAFANGAGAGAGRDAETIWSELKGLHSSRDTVITLAVVTGSGECVTRGRGEGKRGDESGTDADGEPDEASRKNTNGDAETESQKNTNLGGLCCFGARVRELWTLPDTGVDAWLATQEREGKAHSSCGTVPDSNLLLLLPSDGKDVSLVMGTGRAAWVRYPAGGGKGRQTGAERAADAARRVAPVAAAYFSNGHGVDGGRRHGVGGVDGSSSSPSVSSSFLHSTRPDGAATLSFTLANAAPDFHGHNFGWRFSVDVEHAFVVKASEAMKRSVTLIAEGQVLRHVESTFASSKSVWDDTKSAFVLREEQLPFFVDGDWNLDTSVEETSVPPTHFVVYVPPRDRCPLFVVDANGATSRTNAFDIPGWGSVVVWNPETCDGGWRLAENDDEVDEKANRAEDENSSKGSDAKLETFPKKKKTPSRAERRALTKNTPRGWGRVPSLTVMRERGVTAPAVTYLTQSTVNELIGVFAGSLRKSLGLPPNAPGRNGGDTFSVLEPGVAAPERSVTVFGTPETSKEVKPLTLTSVASESGFAVWEADAVARARATQVARLARAALASLMETAANLPDMHVPESLVRGAVDALKALRAAHDAAARGRGDVAVAEAVRAHVFAENAFVNPDFNAHMYFPLEFTLAVYVPLFLPTAFPLLIGAMWDVRHFVRRRRCARAWRAGARSVEEMGKTKTQ